MVGRVEEEARTGWVASCPSDGEKLFRCEREE